MSAYACCASDFAAAACVFLQRRHVAVRDVLRSRGTEHGVARRVVAVMVRVDEEVDLPRAHLLEIAERDRRRVRELRVDDDEAVGRHEHADGAAASREDADVAAQRIE